jgi:Ca-activated chloride channel homolog
MKIDAKDPRLTAYALDEMTPEERVDFEAELECSATARQEIEEIRQTAALLKKEFQTESPLALSKEQAQRIAHQLEAKKDSRPRRQFGVYIGSALAAAASLFLVLGVLQFRKGGDLDRSPAPVQHAVLKPTSDHQAAPLNSPISERGTPSTKGQLKASSTVAPSAQTSPTPPVVASRNSEQTAFDAMVAPLSLPGSPKTIAGGLGPGIVGGVPTQTAFRHAAVAQRKSGATSFLRAGNEPTSSDWERPPQPLSEKDRYVNRFNTEAYDRLVDNPFLQVAQNPLSTFSIDVDTAAYANLRRFLVNGMLPPKDAVRIEEMVNYFSYDYPGPKGKEPFSAQVEVAQAPWNLEHRLVRIGLKGREIALDRRPASNLVFLIDVSGSMQPPNKLPLVKKGLQLLVEKLNENDRVAMVVYAGASGLALPSTSCEQKSRILAALDNLEAGGSTNGGAGIQLAYDTAMANFIKGGTNRVILATDGDFNVGVTNQGDLLRLIEEKAKSGVFLSVLGFGMGNYKDSALEKLADKGNGNYAYVDSINEARKVLVEQMGGTLMTIAKDVKIQIEFNPAQVGAYRLLGYENRLLRAEDFNDDAKDAGEIGAGHTVTALYETVPAGKEQGLPGVDALKYQKPAQASAAAQSAELLTVKLRCKEPEGDTSKLVQFPVADRGTGWTSASRDFKFASAVAAFGMILRDSPHKGKATLGSVLELAEQGKGVDKEGYRAEFIQLVAKARELTEGKRITQ